MTLVPSNVFVAANNRYFSEDFEGSEVDLSENWLERSAYGTSEGDWDDRIVTDPADSGNKVYRMLWSRNSPQLLKWNKPLTSYHLSADVKGGGSYPKFEGQRAHPASIYLRTTLHNLGRPEYQSESPDLESRVGQFGIVITLRDSWISVDIKKSDNAHYDLNNNPGTGNWIYFKNIGNNCNANFTNISVTDDGHLVKIYWNHSLLLAIELYDKELVEYEGKGSGWFYTRAVVRNGSGSVISTVTDTRIAANYDATVAFAARGTELYIDNLSLSENFRYPEYTEDFSDLTYEYLWNDWTEKCAHGNSLSELDLRIVEDPRDSSNMVYKLHFYTLGSSLLKWKHRLNKYEFSADLKGGGYYPDFQGTRHNPASVYLRTTHANLWVPEYERYGDENVVGYAGVVFTIRDSYVSIDIKNSQNSYSNEGESRNWFYFTGKGNNCNTNFTNLHVTDDGNVMNIYWNNELLLSIEMSDIEYITYEGKGSAYFYTKAVVRNSSGTVLSTINDARIAAKEDATIAFAVRGTQMYVDNVYLDTNYETSAGASENAAVYSGSQIRTALVPYRDKEGNIDLDDMRQGLRFCFDILEIDTVFEHDGKSYTVKNTGALVALKDKLEDENLMKVSNAGRVPGLLIQDYLIDVVIDDDEYKSAYIYNIPEANKDTLICARAYLECVSESGDIVYFYTPVQERSLTMVYERIVTEGDIDTLDEAVKAWWR